MQYVKLIIMQILILCIFSTFAFADSFSFAVIADPHIDGTLDHTTKLQSAVNWIIANRDTNNIQLVFVVGDIAWGAYNGTRNLVAAKDILDDLNLANIPYVPVLGDNEVQSGCEQEFNDVFTEQFTYLALVQSNWRKATAPVSGMYLQNYSFDHLFCHFVVSDFVSRQSGDESGELHNFTGGSWPWLKDDITYCAKPKNENILIMTHIGMFRTGISLADQYLFTSSDMTTIKNFMSGYKNNVYANYSGHIHQNWSADVGSFLNPYYYAKVTDETWYDTRFPELSDQALTVRWITATRSSTRTSISYSDHIVDID